MSRIKCYLICTSPRSGSTLLCRLLQQAGTAGVPNSHFHVPSLEAWLGSYGLGGVNFQSRSEALGSIMAAALARGPGHERCLRAAPATQKRGLPVGTIAGAAFNADL